MQNSSTILVRLWFLCLWGCPRLSTGRPSDKNWSANSSLERWFQSIGRVVVSKGGRGQREANRVCANKLVYATGSWGLSLPQKPGRPRREHTQNCLTRGWGNQGICTQAPSPSLVHGCPRSIHSLALATCPGVSWVLFHCWKRAP